MSRYFRIPDVLKEKNELVEFQHTHSFTGEEFKQLLTPSVYIWKRSNTYMYIGQTSRGMQRLCDTKHHVLNKHWIKDEDTILVMSGLTCRQARDLESKLIRENKSIYNKLI